MDLTQFNNSKKILKTAANKIFEATGVKPEFNVYAGELNDAIKEKLLSDLSICAIVFGMKNNSWKDSKLSNLMNNIASFATVPIIMIPQGITDSQLKYFISKHEKI